MLSVEFELNLSRRAAADPRLGRHKFEIMSFTTVLLGYKLHAFIKFCVQDIAKHTAPTYDNSINFPLESWRSECSTSRNPIYCKAIYRCQDFYTHLFTGFHYLLLSSTAHLRIVENFIPQSCYILVSCHYSTQDSVFDFLYVCTRRKFMNLYTSRKIFYAWKLLYIHFSNENLQAAQVFR